MAYRKRTLRTMSPTARKIARLTGELESVSRRLKNLIPDLQRLDFNSQALSKASDTTRNGKHEAFVSTLEYILDYKEDKIPKNLVEWWLRGRMSETTPDYPSEEEPEDLPNILSYENTGIPRP